MGLARFLEFCLDESDANGGAVPVLVAHNSNFDNGMLLGDCWQSGLHVPPQWRSLCTFRMAKRAEKSCCPELASLRGLNLGSLAKHFGCAPRLSVVHALQAIRDGWPGAHGHGLRSRASRLVGALLPHGCMVHHTGRWWRCHARHGTSRLRQADDELACRSSVDTADLHDALQDARQLPIITAGLQRAGGDAWSVEAIVQDLPPSEAGVKPTKPFVDTFANICAARHASMLRKIGVPPPTPPPEPAAAIQTVQARAKGGGKRDRGVELLQASHLAALQGRCGTAADSSGGRTHKADAQAQSSAAGGTIADEVAADAIRRRPRALEEMLVAQRSSLEPDPFLTVTCAQCLRHGACGAACPELSSV